MPLRSPPDAATRVGAAKERAPDAAEPRRIPSEQLLGSGGQAVILHRGREYRLRETQNGKLILTA
jgi:hemin uptake protein HemP